MGSPTEWEKVSSEPLGSGGQSTVFLVRRPERVTAREKSFKILRDLSGQGFSNDTALQFSKAAWDVARSDTPTELAALKIFNPRAAGADAEQQALARMRNEITVLRQHRPGLLSLLDSSESENWIVTEYCSRGTLDRNLFRYKGNAKLALTSFAQLVGTVAALHKESIVHRDIKPQNIFLGHADELLLGDFGIVFLPNLADRLSFTGESVGPRDFMPPWVLLDDHPTINPTFDVYMLGKVLWCMVSGRLKLHREDFLDPRLDLTQLFPNDPDMYIINDILKKCVVTREADCLASAGELSPMILSFLEVLDRNGQLLRDGVPRPCHVCGQGFYHPQGGGDIRLWVSASAGNNTSNFYIRPFVCDKCGHTEFFHARLKDRIR